MGRQHPSTRAEEQFDIDSSLARRDFSDQLLQALNQTQEGGLDFGLGRKGQLSPDAKSRLGKQLVRDQVGLKSEFRARGRESGLSGDALFDLDKASNRAWADRGAAGRTALAMDKETRQRSDLGEIFGGVIQPGLTGLAGLGAGELGEPEKRLNVSQRFLKGVGKGLSLFGF